MIRRRTCTRGVRVRLTARKERARDREREARADAAQRLARTDCLKSGLKRGTTYALPYRYDYGKLFRVPQRTVYLSTLTSILCIKAVLALLSALIPTLAYTT